MTYRKDVKKYISLILIRTNLVKNPSLYVAELKKLAERIAEKRRFGWRLWTAAS